MANKKPATKPMHTRDIQIGNLITQQNIHKKEINNMKMILNMMLEQVVENADVYDKFPEDKETYQQLGPNLFYDIKAKRFFKHKEIKEEEQQKSS